MGSVREVVARVLGDFRRDRPVATAEMVFLDPPIEERVRRISGRRPDDLGADHDCWLGRLDRV